MTYLMNNFCVILLLFISSDMNSFNRSWQRECGASASVPNLTGDPIGKQKYILLWTFLCNCYSCNNYCKPWIKTRRRFPVLYASHKWSTNCFRDLSDLTALGNSFSVRFCFRGKVTVPISWRKRAQNIQGGGKGALTKICLTFPMQCVYLSGLVCSQVFAH